MTANSVYMIVIGSRRDADPLQRDVDEARLPNSVIQPAARTALPTNSGSTSSMIIRFL